MWRRRLALENGLRRLAVVPPPLTAVPAGVAPDSGVMSMLHTSLIVPDDITSY